MAAKQSLEVEAVDYFAGRSHNAWRKQFRKDNPDQADQPRMRMRGGKMVDINQPWESLDAAAQSDNKIAAQVAYEAVTRHPKNREKAAAFVHSEWVKRNRDDPNQPKDLLKPYADLPEIEKDKDRAHIDRMKKALAAVRKHAKRAKKQRKAAVKAALIVDPATAARLEAAAGALSEATGRKVTAEALLTAGVEAVLSICASAAPAAPKKKR